MTAFESDRSTQERLLAENEELRRGLRDLEGRLAESEETLRAIHAGEVDAILVSTEGGEQIYTLKGAEEPYRILIEQMNEGAVTVSEDGSIMYSNQSFARAMRTNLEKIIGTNLAGYIHPSGIAAFRRLLDQSVNGPVRGEVIFAAGDGTQVPMQLSVSFLPMVRVPTYCLIAADLTERIQAENALRKAYAELEQMVRERTSDLERANEGLRQSELDLKEYAENLERSNAELQQFAYVASHDLQEPLRMVTSYLALLEDKYGDRLDGQAKQYMDFASEGGIRAKDLIRDLLEYSRVGSHAVPMVPTNLDEVLERVSRNLKVQIEEERATITHDPLPTVTADKNQMVALMQNLISNAIKFHGPEPPTVHISSEENEKEWVLTVRDNGIGIDPKFKDKIFVIFQRLHTRQEFSGTGIGLAIAKKIADRHGGRIWFESQPCKGSKFYVAIPKRAGK